MLSGGKSFDLDARYGQVNIEAALQESIYCYLYSEVTTGNLESEVYLYHITSFIIKVIG